MKKLYNIYSHEDGETKLYKFHLTELQAVEAANEFYHSGKGTTTILEATY